jgi:hypothetical protein
MGVNQRAGSGDRADPTASPAAHSSAAPAPGAPSRPAPSPAASPAVPTGTARWRWVFAASVAGGLLGVLCLTVGTGLRGALHGLLLALAAAALLPFILVVSALVSFAAAGLITGLVGHDIGAAPAGGVERAGGRLARAYHGLIGRQRRHPFGWGLGTGLGLGVVGVWVALALWVVPLESQTLSVLLLAQVRVEAPKAHPEPAADGLLHPSLWGQAGADPVLDGFGRPIRHARAGASLATSYTLRSAGFDGVPSGDDLCVGGQAALGQARDPLRFLERLYAGELGWSERAQALRSARCEAP